MRRYKSNLADHRDWLESVLRQYGIPPEAKHRRLSTEEELTLIRSIQRDPEDPHLRQRFIEQYIRLVLDVVLHYARKCVYIAPDDLVAVGLTSIWDVVTKRFQVEKGCRFSTYALWYIKRSVQRYVIDNETTIAIPSHAAEKFAKIRRAANYIQAKHGRKATLDEIAQFTNFSKERVKKYISLSPEVTSYDEPLENGNSILDFIADPNTGTNVEDSLKELATLFSGNERIVFTMYYVYDEPCSIDEICATLHISRERVRQIHKTVIAKLRDRCKKPSFREKYFGQD